MSSGLLSSSLKYNYYYGYDDILLRAFSVKCVAVTRRGAKVKETCGPPQALSHLLFQPSPIFHMTKDVVTLKHHGNAMQAIIMTMVMVIIAIMATALIIIKIQSMVC